MMMGIHRAIECQLIVNPLIQDKSSLNETTADRLSGVFGVKYQPIENVSIESITNGTIQRLQVSILVRLLILVKKES